MWGCDFKFIEGRKGSGTGLNGVARERKGSVGVEYITWCRDT
jgi:hypothetical protein